MSFGVRMFRRLVRSASSVKAYGRWLDQVRVRTSQLARICDGKSTGKGNE